MEIASLGINAYWSATYKHKEVIRIAADTSHCSAAYCSVTLGILTKIGVFEKIDFKQLFVCLLKVHFSHWFIWFIMTQRPSLILGGLGLTKDKKAISGMVTR